MYPNLTKPLKIGGITLKNRMLSSPTSMAVLGPDER
jgi:2,4-dienoyl-CoA reductase-like NADH-dependent reductase (Old Yellow Enzyme family)